MSSRKKAKIISVEQLLNIKELNIPNYQRPYKWTVKNVEDLLNDISRAIENRKKYSGYKYRVGTIIIHDNFGKDDIVDGQQRLITLTLIRMYLDSENAFKNSIVERTFTDKVSKQNIGNNYSYIREWFSIKENNEKKAFEDAFKDILEVVIINVSNISEAFQLFDSQNTRGKELDPHDLLKAHHLREMKNNPYEMKYAVTKWESKEPVIIKELFDTYLFPIWNWSYGIKSKIFTSGEIDTFKGIEESSVYSYAKRADKAMPIFQITEPFIAGNNFFEMVDHYINLLDDIVNEINTNKYLKNIKKTFNKKDISSGYRYTKNLFLCALLCYYDKFHDFDERAVKKMFVWAFMLRVDMEHLGYDSINKYAIGGEKNDHYTNHIPMFSIIDIRRLICLVGPCHIKI